MERFFRNPQTIRQRRQGPLGAYIDDFAQLLSDQGYTRECARRRLRLVAEFSYWLWCRHLTVRDITVTSVKRFLRSRALRQPVGPGSASCLKAFLELLYRRWAMAVRLEHANLTVRDINGMIRFLQTAFPEFRVRGDGNNRDGSRWVHVGTDETYIALSPAKEEPEKQWMPYQGQSGVNHLSYEVDDVEALCERMKSAGYKDSTPPNAHPYRNRRYFYDPEGNDWEFVQYLSGNPAERNDYKLPDV